MDRLHGAYSGDHVPPRYAEMVAPHLDSYNYFIGDGMAAVVEGLDPFEVRAWCLHAAAYHPLALQRVA